MIRVLAISFILFLSFADVSRFLVLCHYMGNIKWYANELCENKDVPELQCYGSCQLSEELEKVEAQSNDAPLPIEKIEVQEVSTYDIPSELTLRAGYVFLTSPLYPHNTHFHSLEKIDDIFHPPQV